LEVLVLMLLERWVDYGFCRVKIRLEGEELEEF
jgi:hypothetical protein